MSDLALESGTYSIAGVTLHPPPSVSRPVAVGTASKVVLLPVGFPPSASKWDIKRLENGNYYIKTLGNFYAKPAPEGPDLLVVENEPFEWDIKRDTRLPPPIGDYNFHIQVPGNIRPALSWALPITDSGNADKETPVSIRRAEFPSEIHIFPFKA